MQKTEEGEKRTGVSCPLSKLPVTRSLSKKDMTGEEMDIGQDGLAMSLFFCGPELAPG